MNAKTLFLSCFLDCRARNLLGLKVGPYRRRLHMAQSLAEPGSQYLQQYRSRHSGW